MGAKELSEEELKRYNAIVRQLDDGCNLLKVKTASKTFKRFYFIDREKNELCYDDSEKMCAPSIVVYAKLNHIRDIRDGNKEFNKKLKGVNKNLLFSVVTGARHKVLYLLAKDEKEKETWMEGLTYLVQADMFASQQRDHQKWIKEAFRLADRNEDGGVDMNETMKLFKTLNINMDKLYVKKMFDEANKDKKTTHGQQALNRKEFIDFYYMYTKRQEIQDLFQKYSAKKAYMESSEIVTFLTEAQKNTNIVEGRVKRIVNIFEPDEAYKKEEKLSLDGFRNFLLSDRQRLFTHEHTVVYQDMTQPMNYYYMNSSHNTYLMEDQLKGPSSTEAYIRALKMGCRCVELDCWDGPDGEPIIYHGHTLTSKINFENVIHVVKEYAFVASPYPIVLSLENHCNIEQQKRMAALMKRILGDSLYTTPLSHEDEQLPCPDDLKNKILIKAKKIPEEKNDSDVSDEDEAADLDNAELSEHVSPKAGKKLKIARELSDMVVICRSVHFDGFTYARQQGHFAEMSSLTESKAMKLSEDDGTEYVRHTQHQMVRIYPAGKRTDSSNYNPVPLWNVGSQIVALNFQTHDEPMHLNHGRFWDNGGCGYVLKPRLLLPGTGYRFNPEGPFPAEWARKLTIKVISGYQLPRPDMSTKGEVIDPFVQIQIFGVNADLQEVQTTVVNNNGFNPQWNETFHFRVKVPDLALVKFTLKDYDPYSSNDFIGFYALPFNSMKQGFRQFYLHDKSGVTKKKAIIFIHVQTALEVEPVRAKTPEVETKPALVAEVETKAIVIAEGEEERAIAPLAETEMS